MTQGFENVAQELEQKRLQLEQELQAARGRATDIEADLERVQEALDALTGQKKKARKSARSSKPATTIHDMQRYIAHVRQQNPFVDGTEMEKEVRALVEQSGTSLASFKKLFAEALLTSPGSQGDTHGVHHTHHGHPGHGS